MADVRAKDVLANTARLICAGCAATAAVLMFEAWMRLAPPGGQLEMETPPSEALDRREVVSLIGETFGYETQAFPADHPDRCRRFLRLRGVRWTARGLVRGALRSIDAAPSGDGGPTGLPANCSTRWA